MPRLRRATNSSTRSSNKGKLNTINSNTDTHTTNNLDSDDVGLYNLDEISSDELIKLRTAKNYSS